jgi:hypothetical protein
MRARVVGLQHSWRVQSVYALELCHLFVDDASDEINVQEEPQIHARWLSQGYGNVTEHLFHPSVENIPRRLRELRLACKAYD